MSKPARKSTKKAASKVVLPDESITAAPDTIDTIDTSATIQGLVSYETTLENTLSVETNNNTATISGTSVSADFQENGGKKRGRKPRGGKLILRNTENANATATVSNIILHLKCSMNDLNDYNTKLSRMMTDPLEYNPEVPPEVLTYNDSQGFTTFGEEAAANVDQTNTQQTQYKQLCKCCMVNPAETITELNREFTTDEGVDTTNIKDINAKLKMLKIQLYKNAIQMDKKAACFWCTYDFDNTPCLIPKYEMDDTIYGYGSFCRPECAVAYLMKENIDDSTKFERYQLLNQIYSKVYECKKNIKPAPNPYYLLDKYYGNLTIQEYRKLLKTEHLMLVIDKPLTRILPELHEDNEDMIMNIYGINKSTDAVSGVYKVKRQSEKQQGPSKASIIRNKFGLS
jgi:hypothetical protein